MVLVSGGGIGDQAAGKCQMLSASPNLLLRASYFVCQ